MWGFTPSILTELAAGFPAFLEKTIRENPLKGEYFLPTVVGRLLKEDKAVVQVLPSRDKWYGVTYQADKPVVMDALRRMSGEGLYPAPLWT